MRLDNFPIETLSTAEENEIAVASDKESLVLHNMREAMLYAKKCSYGKLSDGDLVSVCYLGLRDAAANFAPNKIRFFGYAKPYLRGRIYSEFRSLKVVKKSETSTYYPPSPNGWEEQDREGGAIRHVDVGDTEYKPIVPESEDFNFDLTQFREEWQLIEPLVAGILTDKERMILELRYISGYNFRQIGDLFAMPVSRSHVQHIHGIALEKIRAEMAKRKIASHHEKHTCC